jgi:drug/metabolite transporter (DMT)-like permease
VSGTSQQSAASRKLAGIAFMLAGVFSMVGLDVTAKWLLGNGGYSLPQLVFLRSVFSVIIVLVFVIATRGAASLATSRPGLHVFRSLLMAGSTFGFFYALRLIELAEVVTIAFSAPLIVTALARPVLGEHVGWRRWMAVLLGFVGVIVIVQPGVGVVRPGALVALAAVSLYAAISLTSRKYHADETLGALSFWMYPAPIVIAAFLLPGAWRMPLAVDWGLFVQAGVLGGLGFVALTAAMARAPATVLVPFEYTGLLWAALAGYVIWGEQPSARTWIGAGIIIISSLYILYRETFVEHRDDAGADFPLQELVPVSEDD